MSKKYYIDSVEFNGINGDCGISFKGRCPDCGDGIHVAESSWWDTECSCGIEWVLNIEMIGYKRKVKED
jgi:hypothetical protein